MSEVLPPKESIQTQLALLKNGANELLMDTHFLFSKNRMKKAEYNKLAEDIKLLKERVEFIGKRLLELAE